MTRATGIMFQGKAFRKGPAGFESQKADLCALYIQRNVGEGRGRQGQYLANKLHMTRLVC